MTMEGAKLRFEFGPAFFAIVIQTIGGIIAVTMLYASLSNTAANTKNTADRLEIIVDRVKENQNKSVERLVRVETSLSNLSDTVTRIDNKLDALKK